jgi:hypothetical protein
MSDASPSKWLNKNAIESRVTSRAFDDRLGFFWGLNLITVLLPAVFASAAALVPLLPEASRTFLELPLAPALSISAALLVTLHKALKCDDFQAECRRLSQAHLAFAVAADAAVHLPETRIVQEYERLSVQLCALVAEPRRLTSGRS